MKKSNTKQKVMSVLLTGTVLTNFLGVGLNIASRDDIKVSSDLVNALSDSYCEYYSGYTPEDVSNLEISRDEIITKSQLQNVEQIEVHADKFDFNNLQYLNKLKSIKILDAQALSDSDKKILGSNETIETIILDYDYKQMNCNTKLNLDDLSSKNVYLDAHVYSSRNELETLVFYNVYHNLSEEEQSFVKTLNFGCDEEEQMAEWNITIKAINYCLSIDENTPDEEKIVKIVDYVTGLYTYDSYIEENLNVLNEDKNVSQTAINYYDNMLSNVLEDGNRVGICSNYAAITAVVSQYAGLDVSYVSGSYDGIGHAWNNINYNGEKILIDTTESDGDPIYKKLNNEFKSNRDDSELQQMLLDSIFVTEEYDSDIASKYVVSNESFANQEFTKDIDYTKINLNSKESDKYLVIAMVSAIAALLLAAGIVIDKEKKLSKEEKQQVLIIFKQMFNKYKLKNIEQTNKETEIYSSDNINDEIRKR